MLSVFVEAVVGFVEPIRCNWLAARSTVGVWLLPLLMAERKYGDVCDVCV